MYVGCSDVQLFSSNCIQAVVTVHRWLAKCHLSEVFMDRALWALLPNSWWTGFGSHWTHTVLWGVEGNEWILIWGARKILVCLSIKVIDRAKHFYVSCTADMVYYNFTYYRRIFAWVNFDSFCRRSKKHVFLNKDCFSISHLCKEYILELIRWDWPLCFYYIFLLIMRN